uniref:Uncharacterized protein n=1 Tax=Chrysotila carterae TaxID=13221 RepID=A0A7S4BRQ9_CHRCT
MAARAYSTALELVPSDAIAAANLAKLPAGPVYRKAAAAEVRFLARRAAAVALAKLGAKRAGRSLEALGLVRAGDGDADSLASMMLRTVGYLRLLETGQAPLPASVAHLSQGSGGSGSGSGGGGGGLWSLRSAEMPEVLGRLEGGGEAPMTLAAFAWGGVWYHSLMRAFSHPTVRAALVRASRLGGSALVLGSSLGFETYFLALTFGIPSVGVEILSSLVRVSHAVQSEHGVPTSLVSFQCEDALNYRIPSDTAIVYADDTAWDAPALAALAAKLSAELPDGAIVVHNSEHGFASQPAFKLLEVVSVETSWNPSHPVYVHELVRSKKR